MPWEEADFLLRGRIDQYSGAQLFAARQVMARFIAAISGGYADYWFPSPSYTRPQDSINAAIKIIDDEWELERIGRGQHYHSHAQFLARLTPAARAALIEAVEKALRT